MRPGNVSRNMYVRKVLHVSVGIATGGLFALKAAPHLRACSVIASLPAIDSSTITISLLGEVSPRFFLDIGQDISGGPKTESSSLNQFNPFTHMFKRYKNYCRSKVTRFGSMIIFVS